MVGKLPVRVRLFLSGLGARIVFKHAHSASTHTPTANKLLACEGETPLLLLDNDTCFVGPGLPQSPLGCEIMAAPAGFPRVTEDQWNFIEEALGLRPLALPWIPLQEAAEARSDARKAKGGRRFYANSGVVWIRSPETFGALWSEHIIRIAQAFGNHPLTSKSVTGSDQAALATAIGSCGGFCLLPGSFNHRPVCFFLEPEVELSPTIVHLAGMRWAEEGVTDLESAVRIYWEEEVFQRAKRWRRGNLQSMRELLAVILGLCRAYELDEVLGFGAV